ncbi:MAG: hypothetical protein A2Z71_09135 [Chloroflexi bacterium RBG_13_50_21]|nr:MAG: hypothetical protein A2Z71_09135 [Chloroflexi bacterium RBG_13_50_21]
MRFMYLLLTLIILCIPRSSIAACVSSLYLLQEEVTNTSIISPVAGQVVQGAVVIRGSAIVDGFQFYEIDFTHSGDPTQTWFLIQESTLPIQDGILAVWDTTTITDGEYDLRLVISRTEATQMEVSIPGLRVRNYTPIETGTSTSTLIYATQAYGTATITATPRVTNTLMPASLLSTPTPLPANPAEISTSQAILTLGQGAAFTLGIFAILGAYIGLRTLLHERK